MPVIPGGNSPQILSAGSPVPIASGSKAAIGAGAVDAFGDALSKIGATLGESSRRAYAQKQQLDVEENLNTFRDTMTLAELAQQQEPIIPDDIDGTKTFSSFKEKLKDPINALSERIADPQTRRAFVNDANQLASQASMRIYARDVVRRTEENKQQFQTVLSQHASVARNDSSKIDESIVRAQALIAKDVDLLPNAKTISTVEATKNIIKSGYDGELERENFKGALGILDKYAGQFAPDEIDKLRDSAIKTEERVVTNKLRMESLAEAQSLRNTRMQSKKAVGDFNQVLLNGSNEEILAAQNILQLKADAGIVDPTVVSKVISSKLVKNKINSAMASDLTQQAVTGKISFEDAISRIDSISNEDASFDQKIKITMGLSMLKQKMDNDPNFQREIAAGAEKIRSVEKLIPLQGMSRSKSLDQSAQVNRMLNSYYSGLASSFSPNVSPMQAAEGVMQRTGYTLKAGVSDAEISRQQKELYTNFKNSGVKSKEEEKRVQQAILELEKQKILKQEGSNGK